jgi:deoxyribodipyrimidine photo-lyase
LCDADIASNNGGWQWSAGTGTDAQPWFRIFNPILQGERFDTNGDYVRKYVPELKNVPTKNIHAPWLMNKQEQISCGVIIGKTYPQPIVDHATERDATTQMYRRQSFVPSQKKMRKQF